MFFIQDINISDFQTPDNKVLEVYHLSSAEENSSVIKYNDKPTAIYTHELQKPKIVAPQTKTISPLVRVYADKLKNGSPKERAYLMENINSISAKNIREASVFTDKDITDALFSIVAEDISKLKKPTKSQVKARKKFIEGKKLSEKEKEAAFSYSESEIAEQNKMLALYTLGTIQNLTDKIIVKRTGIQPHLHDSVIIEKIIYEAKNNEDAVVRASAIGALHLISKPEYNKELKQIFMNALNDPSPEVQEMAQDALKYFE